MIYIKDLINEMAAHSHQSLTEMANRSGLAPRTVYKYASKAESNPTLESLQLLAEACDYRLEARPKSIPRCPCESCKRIKQGCELSCIPFTDWKRSLIKRRTAWKR